MPAEATRPAAGGGPAPDRVAGRRRGALDLPVTPGARRRGPSAGSDPVLRAPPVGLAGWVPDARDGGRRSPATLPRAPPSRQPQQPPPVQRLRVRYAKRGRLRFTSHRDFSRAFERAVFRARVPMAYSSGFNPHPRISYAGAAPTGSASEAEYLEIALAQEVDPAAVHAALDEALPDGPGRARGGASRPGGSLADRLEASQWQIALDGVEPVAATDAVQRFLATTEVPVERMTKKGLRTFDARSAVLALSVDPPGERAGEARHARPCAILQLVLRHGTPSVRPDDILAGLREIAGLRPVAAPVQQRVAQGPLDLATARWGIRWHPTATRPRVRDRDLREADRGTVALGFARRQTRRVSPPTKAFRRPARRGAAYDTARRVGYDRPGAEERTMLDNDAPPTDTDVPPPTGARPLRRRPSGRRSRRTAWSSAPTRKRATKAAGTPAPVATAGDGPSPARTTRPRRDDRPPRRAAKAPAEEGRRQEDDGEEGGAPRRPRPKPTAKTGGPAARWPGARPPRTVRSAADGSRRRRPAMLFQAPEPTVVPAAQAGLAQAGRRQAGRADQAAAVDDSTSSAEPDTAPSGPPRRRAEPRTRPPTKPKGRESRSRPREVGERPSDDANAPDGEARSASDEPSGDSDSAERRRSPPTARRRRRRRRREWRRAAPRRRGGRRRREAGGDDGSDDGADAADKSGDERRATTPTTPSEGGLEPSPSAATALATTTTADEVRQRVGQRRRRRSRPALAQPRGRDHRAERLHPAGGQAPAPPRGPRGRTASRPDRQRGRVPGPPRVRRAGDGRSASATT